MDDFAEVKTETGKVATVLEREAMSMLHHCMSNNCYPRQASRFLGFYFAFSDFLQASPRAHRKTRYAKPESFYEIHAQRRESCLGVFTSGGTVANIQALLMARTRAFPETFKVGLSQAMRRAGYEDAVIFGSAMMHYSKFLLNLS